jgi:ABC-type uncharacterized transport system involved in gliding motility auxiliary subunit
MKQFNIPKKWMTILGCVSFGLIILMFSLYAATSIFNWYVKIPLAIGILGVLAFWILSAMTSRSARYGSNVALAILLALCILVLINFVSARRSARVDLTAGKQFSLSEQTKKIVRELNKNISITAFYTEDHYRQRYVQDLLGEYAQQSNKINLTFIDPNIKPGQAIRYNIKQNGTVVFESGERREDVQSYQNEEQDFTSAILKLTSEKKKKIYFLDGHGEHDIDGYDDTSYGELKKNILAENYEVSKLLLAGQALVPSDCNVLVVAGPKKPLLPQEEDAIARYLEKGGKAIIMVDPTPWPSLADLLKKWGIQVNDDIILDALAKTYLGDPSIPVTIKYGYHIITAPLTRIMTFFPMARSLTPDIGSRADVDVTKLVETSDDSWGETDIKSLLSESRAKYDEGVDNKGPVSTALAVTLKVKTQEKSPDTSGQTTGEKRILVAIGDSDFVTNKYFQQGNPDLFMNSLNWLSEEEQLISIRPKSQDEAKVKSLTGGQLRLVTYFSIFAVPLILILAGGIVWWKRK